MDEKKHDEILKDVGDWVRRMCPEDKEILKPQDKMQGSSVAGPSLPGRVGFLTNTKNPSLTRIDRKREKESKTRLNFVRRYFPDTVMSQSPGGTESVVGGRVRGTIGRKKRG